MSNTKAQIAKQRGEIAATTHAGYLIPKGGQASRVRSSSSDDEEAENSKKKKMILLAVMGMGLLAYAMEWI
jgi:hypothetical protein